MDYRGFVGPSYVSQSVIADGEELINWYVETLESEAAATRRMLCPTPGITTVATFAESPTRGLYSGDGRVIGVFGNSVKEVFSDGSDTPRGTVVVDNNPATLVTNGDNAQVFITSGDNGYLLDLLTNLLTLAVTGGVTIGGMLDSRFLYLDVTTSTFFISELDGTTFDPTQFTQRSTAPDKWKSLLVAGKMIWLFGERTSDVYFNSGAFPFPFEPFPGGLIQQGTAATFSPAVVGESVIWLAQNKDGARTVQQSRGINPQKISSYAIDEALRTYSRVDDAESLAYQEGGHNFYALSIPSQNVTWVFDDTEARRSGPETAWHKRGTWNSEQNRYDVWHQRGHVYEFNQHLVGDRLTGTLYRQSIDLATDADGMPLRRVRRAPHVNRTRDLVTYKEFEVLLEPGLGLSAGQGSDPLIFMRKSDDGGKTWGFYRPRSAGAIGRYDVRPRWRKCGSARDRVFEVVVSDPIPWRIMGAELDLGEGNA